MMNKYKYLIQNQLETYFEKYQNEKNNPAYSKYSSKIWEAMKYTTLLEGSKRLRAIMCLEIAKLFGADFEKSLPCACALEIMHAYSLIHDDLPCMDNDDLRRGKPSNHKVFGEAIAVLAGDALIPFGAQLIIENTPSEISKEIVYDIVLDYLKCAGAMGIVAGQVADIEAENKKIDIDNLKYIHKYKTGALFKCAILMGAKLACQDKKILSKLEEYAVNFGVLFQVYDDIIDHTLTSEELGKTANKDELTGKLTYVSAYGLDEAKNIFYSLIDKNHAILKELNVDSEIFNEIYELLIKKIER